MGGAGAQHRWRQQQGSGSSASTQQRRRQPHQAQRQGGGRAGVPHQSHPQGFAQQRGQGSRQEGWILGGFYVAAWPRLLDTIPMQVLLARESSFSAPTCCPPRLPALQQTMAPWCWRG